LQSLERQWADAVVRHDVETINRIQADDFEFTDPAGQIWTKARALESVKSGQLQIDAFEMTEFKIRVYGDAAIVNFRVVWNGKYGEADISGPQRMTDVFVRRDGNWRCVSSHTTRIPPPRNGSGGNG
jgi:ketosteroid isomerase-like protein